MSQKTNSLESDESSEVLAVPAQRIGLAQFILSPEQRTALDNRNNLIRLYDTYKNDYLKYYIQNLEAENASLKAAFKNVDFYIMSRVKSKHNYIEDLLIQKAYEMENFLITHDPNVTELFRKRKDYIAEPKKNGYSSLHTTRIVHVPDKDIKFYRETQIKTFRMRETEKNGTAGHSSVYKNNRDLFLEKIESENSAKYFLPQYMHFEFDKKSRKDILVLDSFEANFKYYFGINFDEFMQMRAIQLR